jgi:hypothetical protein
VLLTRRTVQSIIKKYKNTKRTENLFDRGCKRKATVTTDRLTQRKLKLDRQKSARTVTSELEEDLGLLISDSTVKRQALEAGLFDRVARRKPHVNKTYRLKRRKYAKEMLQKPLGL